MTEQTEHKALQLAFGGDGIVAGTVGEALELCKMISASGLIPSYQGNPGAILVAMEMGRELGYPVMKMLALLSSPPKCYRDKNGAVRVADVMIALDMGRRLDLDGFQALQGIAVINGVPKLWGDAMLARVLRSPHYEDHEEWADDEAAHCTVIRKGRKPKTRSFSWEQAKRAQLITKPGAWQMFPDRMLQMRARAFACRDTFADELLGMSMAEESDVMLGSDGAVVGWASEPPPPKEIAVGRHSVRRKALILDESQQTEPSASPGGDGARSEPDPATGPLPTSNLAQNATSDGPPKPFALNDGEAELLGMVSKAETLSDINLLIQESGRRRLRKAAKEVIADAIAARREAIQLEGKDEPGADG